MKMYPRSEFPIERLPEIVRTNAAGRVTISASAIKSHLSARGCPNADAQVVIALIRSGAQPGEALQLAMLAYYYTDKHGPSMHCIDRMFSAIKYAAESKDMQMFPSGKTAEEVAARREGRPSRWGTPEFHRAAQAGKDTSTKYYPYRAA